NRGTVILFPGNQSCDKECFSMISSNPNVSSPNVSSPDISPTRNLASIRRFAFLALIGEGVFAAVVLLFHLFRPAYDIVTRFISEYAVSDPLIAGIASRAWGSAVWHWPKR